MNDNSKRKILFITIFIALLFIVSFSFYFSYQARYLNTQITGLATQIQDIKQQKLPVPKNGLDGYTPKLGVDYFDGIDGKDSKSTNTIVQQPIYTNVPVPGKDGYTPVKGVDYFDGMDARQVELCYISEGVLGQRYIGSEDCNPIEGP